MGSHWAIITCIDSDLYNAQARLKAIPALLCPEVRYAPKQKKWRGKSLLWWVVREVNTLLDVALETGEASFEELLLVGVGTANRVGERLSSVWLVKSVRNDSTSEMACTHS